MAYEAFEDKASVSDMELAGVAELAHRQVTQQRHVAKLEADLKTAKQNLRMTQERDLPDLLSSLGLRSITLTDGSSVEIDETMYAAIAKKNKAAAAQWLIDNGQGSLVKQDIIFSFGKGEDELANKLQQLATNYGFTEHETKDNVNTSAVKAVIKELLAQGIDVPLELFGAHFVRRSIIK